MYKAKVDPNTDNTTFYPDDSTLSEVINKLYEFLICYH